MTKVIYKGFFLDEESVIRLKEYEGEKRLEKETPNQHITFQFRPEELFPLSVMNKTFSLMVVGYGNNEENSGFKVALPEELIPYYRGADVIHVTTSLSENGKAMNTRHLNFKAITPFEITGQLGYYTGKEILFT
ncbi:hypothetical protein CVD28_00475 [Bacillus sp. M6-12]|uniref:hypothetical protein n=1 Tax=Bacillus sp. M6-12 TaxID=2054166 RepID=UPI000C793E80|nr:hypothetical protein [Bacillus sp. M6-12]PLS18909.1 hypothetical protein CVD28_00475 [Bacillus sp. M6-12]